MEQSVAALVGMAGLALTALAAFALYRWAQRKRVRRVERWVGDYLTARYGGIPDGFHVNCSDDRLWPVLVDFAGPHTGNRHYLQFSCAGRPSTFSLLSEREEKR